MSQLQVTPLQPTIGAEIGNVDLSDDLSTAVRDEIYDALLRYKVIFFRDQHISRGQHIAVGRAFGTLQPPLESIDGYPEIRPVESFGDDGKVADVWHSDYSDRREPPLGSILRAVVLPDVGGDTIFADAVAAYETLDPETKQKIENLKALHDLTANRWEYNFSDAASLPDIRKKWPPTSQPIVSVHPDTQERVLYVNSRFTSHIEGMDPDESRNLLSDLYQQFLKPELQVRFSWRPGSIAFWDNRACQHYAVGNFSSHRRMERVDIGGERIYAVGEETAPHPLRPLAG